MRKLKQKLLVGILTAAIAVSAGSGVVWSEADDTALDTASDDVAASEEEGAEEGADTEDEAAEGEAEDAPVTEEQALAEMKKYASNANLELYVNEATTQFAVKNLKSGYIWWSTPYDVDSDPIAMGAQIKTMRSIFYFDAGDPVNHNSSKTTAYEGSVSKDNFKVSEIENGVKFEFSFLKTSMYVPVYVTLLEDSFEVRIPCDEIEENMMVEEGDNTYVLLTLSLLSTLGAGRTDENGYMLVPDGSGAIINFNNGKTSANVYKANVYGRDLAVSIDKLPEKTEQIYLPVYGIVKENTAGDSNALLAVITEGDAYAQLNANVSGQATTSYNSVWPTFTIRSVDDYKIGTKEPLNVYESGDIKLDDIAVRYYVMSQDTITYADLAETYRNYLINEQGLTAKTEANDNDLYLTVLGGTVKAQSVLGFPVNMATVATTYSQALEIVKLLEEQGIDDIDLVYKDVTDGGIVGQISTGIDYSGALGGYNDYKALSDYLSSKNYNLFPSLDIMEYGSSGKGYSFTLNSSKRITKEYATQASYWLSYGFPNYTTRGSWTILSPYYWPDVFQKIIDNFKYEGIDSISLNQATSVLYSDFSRENFDGTDYFVRHDAQQILVDGYKALNDAGISIHAQACNAYALPYVSSITDVPLYSSNYDMFDYDVPFYQMVIHGYIPYASKPVNASSNEDELLLLSLLTGSNLHYELMYADPNDFTVSEYDEYFYSAYQGSVENAGKNYKMFNDLVSSLSDKTITGYERLSATNLKTTYSDGTVIEVNTADGSFKINNKAYNLADFELKGEE